MKVARRIGEGRLLSARRALWKICNDKAGEKKRTDRFHGSLTKDENVVDPMLFPYEHVGSNEYCEDNR